MMNCNNDNEIYSFHVGGGVYSFADGRSISSPIRSMVICRSRS